MWKRRKKRYNSFVVKLDNFMKYLKKFRVWCYSRHWMFLVIYGFIMFNVFCHLVRLPSDLAVGCSLVAILLISDMIVFKCSAFMKGS